MSLGHPEIREVPRWRVVCSKCSFKSRAFERYKAAEACLTHHYRHKHSKGPQPTKIEDGLEVKE